MPSPRMRGRPRTKPPEQRRTELLDAAQALFLEQGIEATAIEQITAAAGVAKGTFYLHFPSKEAVLAGLRVRYVVDELAAIRAEMAQAAEPRARLAAWVRAAASYYLDNIPLHDVVFHHQPAADMQGDHGGDAVLADLAAVLAAGGVGEPDLTARFLFHGLHGCLTGSDDRDGLLAGVERLAFRLAGWSPG